ncbi:MAG TPA: aspartate aminotransferase family protein [Candidatus Sulfotelmatobacter sp.]|nr:aspartate aminotransferase family protein [Candidatus Sulfotelmatobacter sp.]
MATAEILQLLRDYESRNVLFIEPDGSWPIVWERAKGTSVWDANGTQYLDLTGAFGVAAAGHANPNVVKAGRQQMGRLLHAMGDVHPHALKAKLARELSRLTFERWTVAQTSKSAVSQVSKPASRPNSSGSPKGTVSVDQNRSRRFSAFGRLADLEIGDTAGLETCATAKTIFCNSGFEAVEAALKTAMLATGKREVIAFTGSYHGLGYGALNVTHRDFFRRPFHTQLRRFGKFVPFPQGHRDDSWVAALEKQITRILQGKRTGAILVEPVQARGGIIVPPPEFLPTLRALCDRFGALLIADEVYTGFGRTGAWFACEHSEVIPDLVCLGKALTGGFPLSACVGRADVMDAAWPPSKGEAIHTSTFLGHPVGCAMALAQIKEIKRLGLCGRSAELGRFLLAELSAIENEKLKINMAARGLGLMAGLEVQLPDGSPAGAETFAVIKTMLKRGYILLPEGEHGNVISFTPPLTISKSELTRTARALREILVERFGG